MMHALLYHWRQEAGMSSLTAELQAALEMRMTRTAAMFMLRTAGLLPRGAAVYLLMGFLQGVSATPSAVAARLLKAALT